MFKRGNIACFTCCLSFLFKCCLNFSLESQWTFHFVVIAYLINFAQKNQAYRDSWTLDARVGHWTLDAKFWTLDSGRWPLDARLWTLDSGRWTLDAGRWTLNADHWALILRTVLILCSQSGRVSQRRNDTLIILQTKNRADSFFITGKYHTKKQNITSHLKVFLKRATH